MNVRGLHLTARKPGWQPPAELVAAMRWIHPRVRLVYSPKRQAWAMIEHGLDGGWHWIAQIDGLPNRQNTIQRLNELRMASIDDIDRVEGMLDESEQKVLNDELDTSEEQIQEGHDMLARVLSPDTVVAMPGAPKQEGKHGSG